MASYFIRRFVSVLLASTATFLAMPAFAFDPNVALSGDRFVQNLPSDWSYTLGDWRYFDVVDCFTAPVGICYGSNPTSPYAFPAFPNNDTGLPVKSFQLEQNESIVMFFRTAPKVRYFAFTQYLFMKAGSSTTEFASLSDSINNAKISTTDLDGDDLPFNEYAVLVWTPDLKSRDQILNMLKAQGHSESSINFLPLPVEISKDGRSHRFNFGYGATADEFTMLMRMALPESQAELDSYISESPFYVVKVGPSSNSTPSPVPTIGYQSDLTGVSESALLPNAEGALDLLVNDIKRRYGAQFAFTNSTVEYTEKTGWDCILGEETCAGDNRDALYSRDTGVIRVSRLQDFVLVVGVNHRQTGKATYFNHSIYDLKKIAGIAGVSDLQLTSASALYHAGVLPGTVKARTYKNLYAYMISYDCAGRLHCLEIPEPTPANPVGLEPGAPFLIAGRSYLEPRSQVRPAPSEVIKHRVFIGSKR